MSKPLILMYHRIADEPIDYWGLAVSPANFEEQLSVICRTRHPVPLAEFVRDLVAGTLHPDAVVLTFDDGYVDNLLAGLPRLAAANVPATVFLASGYLDRLEPFWWDELSGLILLQRDPMRLEVEIEGKLLGFDLGHDSGTGTNRPTASALKSPHDALEAIYNPTRFLDEEQRGAVMTEIRSSFAGRAGTASLPRAMTTEEVRHLAASGLVTIGAHTVTHPSLPGLEAAACQDEVTESKLACEAVVGMPVAAFSYPYGEFNPQVREAVKSAGFAFACATRGGDVTMSDIFTLPRVYVPNIDGDAFEKRLRWMSRS